MENRTISTNMNEMICVLTQGKENMRELQAQLDRPFSAEACRVLAAKTKSAISSALSMAKLLETASRRPARFDSPPSASDSPGSDGSDKAFKELERRELCKKRKTLPRWSSQVRASCNSSMDGSLVDGYSWRKYGQKDILGAKFPRGYYRCTYRHTHGCLATKQVQRSDDDNSLLDVTYRGAHTCNNILPRNPTRSPKKDENLNQNSTPMPQHQHQHQQQQQQQLLLLEHFKTGLSVKTEGLLNYSPTFVSSYPSVDSNCFSLSPCGGNNYGGEFDLHGLDAEIAELISAATSTDFPFDFS